MLILGFFRRWFNPEPSPGIQKAVEAHRQATEETREVNNNITRLAYDVKRNTSRALEDVNRVWGPHK